MLKSFHFNSPDELISNTYVFGNEGRGCYIIDLGKFDSRIEKYINEHHNGIIYAIILTHGHFDHISGIKTVLDKGYNPVLFISSEEEEFLENTRLNCSSMYKEEITLNYGNKILVDDEDEIDVIDEILKDNTFITLKIRQCFYFFSMEYDFSNGIDKKKLSRNNKNYFWK